MDQTPRQLVPKVSSVHTKGSETSSQKFRGYISVLATRSLLIFQNKGWCIFNNRGTFLIGDVLFRTTFRISNYERPVPTKRAKICSIEVKLCNASLHMLPVCIRSYLKSVPRYKFLISHICYPGCINMCKDVKFRGYFSKPKGACEQKSLEKTDLDIFSVQFDLKM